jgi:hypothetical protein
MDGYNDRSVKERKEELLEDMSRREAMIYVSEVITKPAFGKDVFGVAVASKIEDGVDYAISDGGFEEELVPLINRVRAENILLVQLTRNGCDYSSDSRRYFNGRLEKEYVIRETTEIDSEHVLSHKFPIRTYRVHNNGSLEEFHDVLQDIYDKERDAKTENKT